jgi:hypothetical protein
MVLMRSTEKGRKQATVQYVTARKARATLTVLWECSPRSGLYIVLSSGSRKVRYIATLCPSESRWYKRFASGISARMGDIVSNLFAFSPLPVTRFRANGTFFFGNSLVIPGNSRVKHAITRRVNYPRGASGNSLYRVNG